MNGKITRRGFVALAGGLLVGGVLAGTALAQQMPTDPTACPAGFGGGPGRGQGLGTGPGAACATPVGPAAGPTGVAHAAIAAALGMAPEELIAAQRAGETIAELAQEEGVDLETVVAAAVGAHTDTLAARVQADQARARMEARIREHVVGQYGPGDRGGPFGPRMGPGWRGPGMGPGFGPRWQDQ